MRRKKVSSQRDVDTLMRLYELYDGRRKALLWFLHELNSKSYNEYKEKYTGTSRERAYFTSVCGFFELSGVLLKRGLINQDLFFDVFNPSPYWERAKPIVEGMKKERPHIYENFELLHRRRNQWARTRPPRVQAKRRE